MADVENPESKKQTRKTKSKKTTAETGKGSRPVTRKDGRTSISTKGSDHLQPYMEAHPDFKVTPSKAPIIKIKAWVDEVDAHTRSSARWPASTTFSPWRQLHLPMVV